jgi:hypothetical protein
MSVRRPAVIGWALLVAGGWAATLWLGEPSATAGPGPVPVSSAPGDNPGPGPQPEGSCATPRAASSPSASADPSLPAKVPDTYRKDYAVQVLCAYLIVDTAVAR